MGLILLLLFAVLSLLFHNQFLPGHTLFSNDGPLGALMSHSHRLPYTFSGGWQDLNSIGFRESGGWPNITFGLMWLLGPVGFSKFYAPIALLILGLGAWCFLRQLGLRPLACLLGGVAASLNSGFFSAACWGVAGHCITIGMTFFGLAALVKVPSQKGLVAALRLAIGGLAIGMSVAEGADIGAIFSIYVALFMMYQAWLGEGPVVKKLASGAGRVAVVALFAALLAVQLITSLIGTQIQGVAGNQQDTMSKEQRWDWATQWSLPKREALGLVVPGLFGYRMDTPDGGVYWGAAGRDPSWYAYWANGSQGQPPGGPMRFTGGGNYAGVLVVLVALWAVLQAWRKKDSVFSTTNQRWVKFWFWVMLVSLLLAFGRFAPFYRFLYALPYFSTIRNPAKFVHIVNWALIVLFAYGIHGLWSRYAETAGAAGKAWEGLKGWWRRVGGFDRRWTVWSLVALGACVLGWLIYASSRDGLEHYLQQVQFGPEMAKAIAGFSLGQVGWFLLFFAVALGLVVLFLGGAFQGRRARWGAVLLGLFLVIDLGRANQPWIVTWDYQQKYEIADSTTASTNPIINKLRDKPYEHRVARLPRYFVDPRIVQLFGVPQQLAGLEQYFSTDIYGIEWAQHQFLYYDIQSLDLVQMSRMPEDLLAYESKLAPRTLGDFSHVFARHWELTNTRYLLGAAGFLDFLNGQIDPQRHRFRIVERFTIGPKPGVHNFDYNNPALCTAVPDTNGNFALFEFAGALPRAKLYANWQVTTNDVGALDELASPAFDPEKTVLVAADTAIPAPAGATNQNAGTVSFTGYAPKDVVLKADAAASSVLLLNDRFDPNWKVFVDGKPQRLLRCNYIMRGVALNPGAHTVEFHFQPPMNTFYVSLGAVILGLVLCGLLLVVKGQPTPSEPARPPVPGKRESSGAPAAAKGAVSRR